MRIHQTREIHSSILLVIIILAGFCFAFTELTTERFVDNRDKTVTDNTTGLMWAKSVASQKMILSEAQSYAKNSSLGGHKNWRVPTKSELEIIGKAFPGSIFDIESGEYVTSSESQEQSGSIYVIGIYPEKRDVAIYYNGSKGYPFFVWLVRNK